jgi:hypothetical protein
MISWGGRGSSSPSPIISHEVSDSASFPVEPTFWNGLAPVILDLPVPAEASVELGSAWFIVFATYAEAASGRGASLLESVVSWVFRRVSTCSIVRESV